MRDFQSGGNAKRNQLTFGTFKFQHGTCDSLLIYQWIEVPCFTITVTDMDGQEWPHQVSSRDEYEAWVRQKAADAWVTAQSLARAEANQKYMEEWRAQFKAQPPSLYFGEFRHRLSHSMRNDLTKKIRPVVWCEISSVWCQYQKSTTKTKKHYIYIYIYVGGQRERKLECLRYL